MNDDQESKILNFSLHHENNHNSGITSSSSVNNHNPNDDGGTGIYESRENCQKTIHAKPGVSQNEQERNELDIPIHDEKETNSKKIFLNIFGKKFSSVINPSTVLQSTTTSEKHSRNKIRNTPNRSNTTPPSIASLLPLPSKIFTFKRLISLILLSIAIVFMTLFAQGVLHLMTYRNNFGHAPIPESPSHGVIVAHSNNTIISTNKNDMMNQVQSGETITSTKNTNAVDEEEEEDRLSNYTFKAFYPPPPQSSSSFKITKPPLRLLVIGDSIARGVGQAHNCYPVLPQSLAKYLSRHLESRVVYWTAVAKPGASTKWVSDLVEEEVKRKKKQLKQQRDNVDERSSTDNSNYSLEQFKERHVSQSPSLASLTKQDWITNLQYHQKLYEQNPFADYDIVIVMSGLNDIKRMLVPFLLDEEVVEKEEDGDPQEVEQQQKKERGFPADMKRLIHLLNYGNPQNRITNIMETCSEVSGSGDVDEQTSKGSCIASTTLHNESKKHRELPMIVFPRFPTNINPVKMGTLLRKIAIYMSGLMDDVKERISNQYVNVISPDPPGPKTAYDYLDRHPDSEEHYEDPGELINQKSEVIVNLIDMKCMECKKKEEDMSEFYSTKHPKDYCIYSPVQKLFAPDGLHPR